MKMKTRRKMAVALMLTIGTSSILVGCGQEKESAMGASCNRVFQTDQNQAAQKKKQKKEQQKEHRDRSEKNGDQDQEDDSQKKHWPKTEGRLVATSMATTEMMEKLKLDLVGVPKSDVDKKPRVYRRALEIGLPMNPDMELIRSLQPRYVFSPLSLVGDLKPRYDQAGLDYGFVNLNTVPGLYHSLEDLGKLCHREEEAGQLVHQYQDFMVQFKERHRHAKKPKVLILMGLPGSYVVATEHSYVGSLVKMAGGLNVYAEAGPPFLNVNVEDMLKKNPDIILRTAHALPDRVMAMFAKEFQENNNWKHFEAVKNQRVYDLNHQLFGMSAKFNYPEALENLEGIFYGNES